jgi:hypothetical protein
MRGFNSGKSAQKLEHKHETVDGKAVWGKIESELSSLKDVNLTDDDGENLKYNSSLNELYDEMDVIINKFGMSLSEFCPKSNHFFTQLKNIVKAKSNFNIQINRIAQLGFNAGQLSVFIKKNTLCEDRRKLVADLVEKYNMFNLDTYVSLDVQSVINTKYLDGTEYDLNRTEREIKHKDAGDEEQEGGGKSYYEKYMKYKAKYMKLKSDDI